MKTLDWVKQHIKEWPEECTHITVDDNGAIWINQGDVSKSSYFEGLWCSDFIDQIRVIIERGVLEDNSQPILKEDFERGGKMITKLTANHYVDV